MVPPFHGGEGGRGPWGQQDSAELVLTQGPARGRICPSRKTAHSAHMHDRVCNRHMPSAERQLACCAEVLDRWCFSNPGNTSLYRYPLPTIPRYADYSPFPPPPSVRHLPRRQEGKKVTAHTRMKSDHMHTISTSAPPPSSVP